MDVKTKLQHIRNNIEQACEKSNRNINEITLIAVTKYVTIERIKETINTGIMNLGENRQEGFLEKYKHIENDQVRWHFIGTLQTRKVRDVINKVDAIHSLDRMSLAKEINKRANLPKDCFVQVNISGEEAKHGLSPDEVLPFIEEMVNFDHIQIVGLMTMAPETDDEQLQRDVFKKLAKLRDTIKEKHLKHAPCQYLSMGMSNDYQIAIEEGATHIRIGSKLVGPE